MKKIITSLLFLFTFHSNIASFKLAPVLQNVNENDGGCLKLEIMILADLSGSVKTYEKFVHDATYAFADKFELADEGIRIGLVTFNSRAFLRSELTSDKESLKKAINYIGPYTADGGTNMLDALQVAHLEMMTRGRPDVLKMFIVISDGEPNDTNNVLAQAMMIKSLPGNMIWGIFIQKTPDEDENSMMQMVYGYRGLNNGAETLKEISSPNCYVETDYQNLIKELEKLDICL